jgi:predicted esterase
MASQQYNDPSGQASSPASSPPKHKDDRSLKGRIGEFPDPMVVAPELDHRQTFIMLHDRGSTAEKFAQPLLAQASNKNETIQSAFPHAKLIFLTAPLNKATVYKQALTHQWFNGWKVKELTERQELGKSGLQQSCKYVHGILQNEIDEIGEENVVLWGLSQGCATALISHLTWNGDPFAATVGMCGYLPLSNHIRDLAEGKRQLEGLEGEDEDEVEDDIFYNSDDSEDSEQIDRLTAALKNNPRLQEITALKNCPQLQAINFLTREFKMEKSLESVHKDIPVFLGHGTLDEKVPQAIGRDARDCLGLLGVDVTWRLYGGLGHCYSEEMLGDIIKFLRRNLDTEEAGVINRGLGSNEREAESKKFSYDKI